MEQIEKIVKSSQKDFNQRIEKVVENKLFDVNMYKRFLNMQYHLTKGVQRHFFLLASSEVTFKQKKFRKWLIDFGLVEEPHYLIAKKDLESLGYTTDKIPLDIELWWLYFDEKMKTEPLTRIGATTVLENISNGTGDLINKMLASADFITPDNCVFLRIHQHGPNLDHGNEVIEAIKKCDFSEKEFLQVVHGAKVASSLYLKALDSVIDDGL